MWEGPRQGGAGGGGCLTTTSLKGQKGLSQCISSVSGWPQMERMDHWAGSQSGPSQPPF